MASNFGPGGPREKARAVRSMREYQHARAQEALRALYPGSALYGPLQSQLGRPISGPLVDQNWDAMFQAWEDAGVDKVGFGKPDMMSVAGSPISTTSGVYSTRKFGAPMRGLTQAMPESHNAFMKRHGR